MLMENTPEEARRERFVAAIASFALSIFSTIETRDIVILFPFNKMLGLYHIGCAQATRRESLTKTN